MNWTREAPTAPGFYWLRSPAGVEVVRVDCNENGAWVSFFKCEDPEDIINLGPACEWAGPIHPPE